jgi:hypothetical protein
MRGTIPPLPQHAFVALCSVKLYLKFSQLHIHTASNRITVCELCILNDVEGSDCHILRCYPVIAQSV